MNESFNSITTQENQVLPQTRCGHGWVTNFKYDDDYSITNLDKGNDACVIFTNDRELDNEVLLIDLSERISLNADNTCVIAAPLDDSAD